MAEQDPNAAAESPPPRPDDVGVLLMHPMVAIASDPPRVLASLVRDRRVISLEEAIRKMTSLPAGHFGLAGRGVIREGAAADLVIFDPALVRDAVPADPSLGSPEGIASVIVNGVVVVREGELSAARPGQVLRRQK
jgi:N-acyl-D-amino-acid deacylase